MTAALPANLTERVLEVIGRQRGGDRSVIFISHRMIEIAAVCDRATVLREGETVGVVDVDRGVGGADRRTHAGRDRRGHGGRRRSGHRRPPRAAARDTAHLCARPGGPSETARRHVRPVSGRGPGRRRRSRARARTSCSTSSPAPTVRRPASCWSMARRSPFRHPADAIRAGLVYVPADRAEALLMQRSVRENIALPWSAPPAVAGASIRTRRERNEVDAGSPGSRSTRGGRARSAGCRAAISRR